MKILFCLLMLFVLSVSTFADEPKRLAVMISAAWSADEAMHNDLIAMHHVLRQRGLRADEILSIEGKLNRSFVLGLLNEIGKDVATWREGEIFFYYTGHGSLEGKTAKEAIVGLQLSMHEKVSWNEVFAALRLPPKVRLILLPDSWHTNLLAGRVPANVTAIIMKTAEGEDEMVCQTSSAFFDTREGKIKRGVISFYATKALPEAITVEYWLRLINELMTADVKNGRLRFERSLQISGDGKIQLPKVIKSAKD